MKPSYLDPKKEKKNQTKPTNMFIGYSLLRLFIIFPYEENQKLFHFPVSNIFWTYTFSVKITKGKFIEAACSTHIS